MSFNEYVQASRAKHTKKGALTVPGAADMNKRWIERILPRHLHSQGEAGAEQYLADYGRGIGAPKCVALALQAEVSGYPAMALGFWKRAYTLETGVLPDDARAAQPDSPVTAPTPVPVKPEPVTLFPTHLAPGRLITMQPVDAPRDREFYINSPDYFGQPKRDGNRMIIGVERHGIWYQARSLNLRPMPSRSIRNGLKKALKHFGPFVLDGELYYPSVTGSEHRTGAQAATANIEAGHGDVQPKSRYAIFKALYFKGLDLTGDTEVERLDAGASIARWLLENGYGKSFECLPTALTAEEKRALVAKQQQESREGEIWVNRHCRYAGGKTNGAHPPIVRTKYVQELEVIITGLTPTTAQGRPFGALEVASLDGKPLGAIGTGFAGAQMREIARRHAATPGQVRVIIGTQGFTETGSVWHGRFVDFL